MNDFNFFAEYNQNARKSRDRAAMFLLLAIFAVCVFILASVMYYIHELSMLAIRYEINNHTAFLAGADTQLAIHEELSQELDGLRDYNTMVEEAGEQLKADALINTGLMSDISDNIPVDVSILSLSVSQNNLALSGIGGSKLAIAQFQHNLVKLGYVPEVFISSISEEDSSFNFSMSVKLGEVAGNE